MPATETFQFGCFTLRPARLSDLMTAFKWTQADPAHRDGDPRFWIEQVAGIESYILEDSAGPVFFFKMQNIHHVLNVQNEETEIHIQFPPHLRPGTRRQLRVMRGLILGCNWLEKTLCSRGISTVSFISENPELIRFCERRFGFACKGNRLTKPILPERILEQ